ncbi:MAG: hypothetical protein ACR2FG_09785 [Marmoricola sp.]
MDEDAVIRLLADQHGVIARRQVLALGGDPFDIARLLRRREWVRLLPGVFVNHTGEPTWLQRAWGGVLSCWPSALSHDSSLRAAAGPGWRRHDDRAQIHIAVEGNRNIRGPAGYRIHRVHSLHSRVQWNLGPPRVRLEEAALDVAAAQPDEFSAIAVLADACQSRRTTPARMREAIGERSRLRRRVWLTDVLDDIAEGTCSVLEHGYLTRIERAHQLPRARRQPPDLCSTGPIYRDVSYVRFGLVVELDGRLFHDSAGQRDRDLDRDLEALVISAQTVRLGWGQVFARPCWTAERVGALLQRGGWASSPRRCGPTCAVRAPGSSTTWCP